jgi:antirestriction protein ArdC
MNAEAAKKIADQALTTLTDALAQGKSATLTQYLAMMARFHRYSFRNICLIAMQRPEATQVAGFTTWKQMGRFVKGGEKGIVIVAPMLIKPKEAQQAESAPSSTHDEDGKPIMRFRGVYVFDIAQTDGEPLPELSRIGGDPGDALQRLQKAIRSRGIKLDHEDLPPGCDGVSRGGHISIRPGMPPAEEFSVTVHELAHELLHRQDADAPESQPRPSKTVRETQAEAVAYVVCSAIGLEVGDASRDYIQLYNGDAKTLIASMEAVQVAAAKIIDAITPMARDHNPAV